MTTQHFTIKEFECKCGCGFDYVQIELLQVLEQIRHKFNLPVIVNSACRCRYHNEAVGGKTHSYHLMGMAADIHIKGVPPQWLYDIIDDLYPDSLGLLCYENFVHVDIRSGKKFRMTHNGENNGR